MRLAAIDIGSNAVRLQITQVISYEDNTTFKKLQYIRFPLRFGEDVFSLGEISKKKQKQFLKLMYSFKTLIDLYEVDSYYACATSAMREAKNGQELADAVHKDSGLRINIISGTEEAEMINKVIFFHLSEDCDCLHIDVGGGSTELNLYQNKEKIASKSFSIGSVRLLKKRDKEVSWDKMKTWIDDLGIDQKEIISIGTGGNIKKLFELTDVQKSEPLPIDKLEDIQQILENMTLEERMYKLQLNADRADVIVPASKIYLYAMRQAGSNRILVPDVGLKDGIMAYLYQISVIEKTNFKFNN